MQNIENYTRSIGVKVSRFALFASQAILTSILPAAYVGQAYGVQSGKAPEILDFGLDGGETRKATLRWTSEIDEEYMVEASDDLASQEWDLVGDVGVATNLSMSATFEGEYKSRFFRVRKASAGGDGIAFESPAADAICVPLNSPVLIKVGNYDPEKEELVLCVNGRMVGDDEYQVIDGMLVYNAAEAPLGTNGQDVVVTVSRTNKESGHAQSATASFSLESQLRIECNDIVVIGDESGGQETMMYRDGQTAVVNDLTLLECTESTLVFAAGSVCDCRVGQLFASAISTNMFYRVATGVATNANGTITVATEEASLCDFISGSITSDNLLGQQSNVRSRTLKSSDEVDWSSGFSRQINENEPPRFFDLSVIKFEDMNHWWTATINGHFSLRGDYKRSHIENSRLEVAAGGEIIFRIDPSFTSTTTLALPKKAIVDKSWKKLLGFTPTLIPIPVWVKIQFTSEIGFEFSSQAIQGARGRVGCELLGTFNWHRLYRDGAWQKCPDNWCHWDGAGDSILIPESDSLSAKLVMDNKLGFYLESAVGLYVSMSPFVEASRSVTRGSQVEYSEIVKVGLSGELGVEAGFIGYASAGAKLFHGDIWSKVLYSKTTMARAPEIVSITDDVTAKEGERVQLFATLADATGVSYGWYYHDELVSRDLILDFPMTRHAEGLYTFRAENAIGKIVRDVRVSYEPDVDWLVGTWTSQYIWKGSAWSPSVGYCHLNSLTTFTVKIDNNLNAALTITKSDKTDDGETVNRWSETSHSTVVATDNGYILGSTKWSGYDSIPRPVAQVYMYPLTSGKAIMEYDHAPPSVGSQWLPATKYWKKLSK